MRHLIFCGNGCFFLCLEVRKSNIFEAVKELSLIHILPVALASWWPSLHPLDLLVGLCCGAGLRLAVYLKSKNAKKYRHGMEYGSTRWGTREDIAPYVEMCIRDRDKGHHEAGLRRCSGSL